MIILLNLAAVSLLVASLTLAEGGHLIQSDLLILSVTCLLLARLVRIEHRLDRIEGIEPSVRRSGLVASWASRNRSYILGFGVLALLLGLIWYSWPIVDLAKLRTSPAAHPILLVWIPLGALVGLFILAGLAMWVAVIAVFFGYSRERPLLDLKLTLTHQTKYILNTVALLCMLEVMFIAMPYGFNHVRQTFPALNDWLDSWTGISIFFGVIVGWLPLASVATWLRRHRERKTAIRNRANGAERSST
jgi:hypothetical protein